MHIVSGPMGNEKIHFIGPPADFVDAEMDNFIDWFNLSRNSSMPGA